MINLKEKLDSNLSSSVRNVLRTIREHKKDVDICLVGGVVRDLLLGREIFDVDITVEGDAVKLARSFEKKGIGKIRQIQKDLRTAKVRFENDIEIDFASTRTETYPKKGHLPVITQTGCPLKEDVKRRDFTVNSLAVSLNDRDYGDVKDYVNGLDDLEKKQLRVLHDDSFIDDPTRILRGLKFSVRFGFELEARTKELQTDYLYNRLNPDICHSRIKSELAQTFSLNKPEAFEKFTAQGIYRLINPDARVNFDPQEAKILIEKYSPKHVWTVYTAPFLIDSPVIDSLGLTKPEKKVVFDLSKLLSSGFAENKYEIYKLYKGVSTEAIISYYAMSKNPSVILYLDELRFIKPAVNGSDLIKLGLSPSDEFGEIFDEILKKKFDAQLLNKEDELEFIKKTFLPK